jgi:NAD(P)H-hydrate repair Nnr-like enzyme with NAD(P)H-hydrate dehydratase domain
LNCDSAAIQRDRPAAAQQLARHYQAWVVLKGAGSICAAPDGSWRINPTGNPGMSSAGMGDVLSGMLAALLAQGMAPFEALQLAVYLHGAAADALVARGVGPVGLTAGEVLREARALLNQTAQTAR